MPASEKISVGIRVTFENIGRDGTFAMVPPELPFNQEAPKSRKLDPDTEPFMVFLAQDFNLLQDAIDASGAREKIRHELFMAPGGFGFVVKKDQCCKLGNHAPLNKAGEAWKAYAEMLVSWNNGQNLETKTKVIEAQLVLRELGFQVDDLDGM